jgi:transglutaminase-like putative cysteine protease
MRRAGAGARRVTGARPVGISAGMAGLVFAWLGGAAVARLTGATPVVIVLASGVVWFLVACVTGWLTVRRAAVVTVEMPPLSTAGEPVPIVVVAERVGRSPTWTEVSAHGACVAEGWLVGKRFVGTAVFARRGLLDSVDVAFRSAGAPALVWWRRRVRVATAEHAVAPVAAADGRSVTNTAFESAGAGAGRTGAVAGDTDGVRPWREGDSERSVHWSSSIRTGELIVHDRRQDAERRVVVRARTGMPDPDAEAGAARASIESGLRAGAIVSAAVGDGDPIAIVDTTAAARWTAGIDLGQRQPAASPRGWPQRALEPSTSAPVAARWWCAAATAISIVMLSQALSYGLPVTLTLVLAVVAGAAASARPLATGEPVSGRYRLLVAIGALGGFVLVAARVTRLDGVLSLLRGPLPQVLMILIALHGFECRDRRTTRVGLGVSAIVVMYAGGLVVDGAVVWWLVAWSVCFVVATAAIGLPVGVRRAAMPGATVSARRFAAGGAWLAGGVAATIAVLLVVPVPEGPARLTLPTLIPNSRDVSEPGAIASPAGDVTNGGADTRGRRGAPGQAGGYAGFAQSMDTSVRGAMSDDVVMRVRAPAPAFWRGQTFDEFDGRVWYADDEIGRQRTGPNIRVPPALGDLFDSRDELVPVEQFVQTFYVEADMPNVVFAAYRPVEVVIDADAWTRVDGAIRASTVLTEGSVYTVVSAQPQVTATDLRRQGDIGSRLSDFGSVLLAPYLHVPPTTTDETIALAGELARGKASSYDVVLAYEQWLADHVQYDLDSPVPPDGVDAVHDFLFNSRLGFCEQIASALTVMLRTQGIPARLATGYVAGQRDQVAGVYKVRGSDAHAWVEVWFPTIGWQAFDPTASVPLSAEASLGSIGDDLTKAAAAFVDDHRLELIAVITVAIGVIGGLSLVVEIRRRRRRGRWGLLQDRFDAAAVSRGARPGATNLGRAAMWTDADDAAVAREVAVTLDRVAFDPEFAADEHAYVTVRESVGSLRHRRR